MDFGWLLMGNGRSINIHPERQRGESMSGALSSALIDPLLRSHALSGVIQYNSGQQTFEERNQLKLDQVIFIIRVSWLYPKTGLG